MASTGEGVARRPVAITVSKRISSSGSCLIPSPSASEAGDSGVLAPTSFTALLGVKACLYLCPSNFTNFLKVNRSPVAVTMATPGTINGD